MEGGFNEFMFPACSKANSKKHANPPGKRLGPMGVANVAEGKSGPPPTKL